MKYWTIAIPKSLLFIFLTFSFFNYHIVECKKLLRGTNKKKRQESSVIVSSSLEQQHQDVLIDKLRLLDNTDTKGITIRRKTTSKTSYDDTDLTELELAPSLPGEKGVLITTQKSMKENTIKSIKGSTSKTTSKSSYDALDKPELAPMATSGGDTGVGCSRVGAPPTANGGGGETSKYTKGTKKSKKEAYLYDGEEEERYGSPADAVDSIVTKGTKKSQKEGYLYDGEENERYGAPDADTMASVSSKKHTSTSESSYSTKKSQKGVYDDEKDEEILAAPIRLPVPAEAQETFVYFDTIDCAGNGGGEEEDPLVSENIEIEDILTQEDEEFVDQTTTNNVEDVEIDLDEDGGNGDGEGELVFDFNEDILEIDFFLLAAAPPSEEQGKNQTFSTDTNCTDVKNDVNCTIPYTDGN